MTAQDTKGCVLLSLALGHDMSCDRASVWPNVNVSQVEQVQQPSTAETVEVPPCGWVSATAARPGERSVTVKTTCPEDSGESGAMSLTAYLGMLRRWAGWTWRAVKLGFGLLLAWIAGSMISVLVGPDLGRWIAPTFAVLAIVVWVGMVISHEPLRSLTISRPRVARNKDARRSHRCPL